MMHFWVLQKFLFFFWGCCCWLYVWGRSTDGHSADSPQYWQPRCWQSTVLCHGADSPQYWLPRCWQPTILCHGADSPQYWLPRCWQSTILTATVLTATAYGQGGKKKFVPPFPVCDQQCSVTCVVPVNNLSAVLTSWQTCFMILDWYTDLQTCSVRITKGTDFFIFLAFMVAPFGLFQFSIYFLKLSVI
jgi:hypothetical protein